MTVATAHTYPDLVQAVNNREDYLWVAKVIRGAKNLTRHGRSFYLRQLRRRPH